MNKSRLEAFSDGVLAIIITIMVLEFKVPEGDDWKAFLPLIPKIVSYMLSFIYIGIYWNNHHHMFQMAKKVNGKILWANLHLLFWLSLIPFVTGWNGDNHFAAFSMMLYGIVLLMAGFAYFLLQIQVIKNDGPESKLSKAIGAGFKEKASVVMCLLGIGLSFASSLASGLCYIAVAATWLIPDKRIEHFFENENK